MAIWPQATYLGPPDANWAGSMQEFRGLVEHIAEGSYQGTISWQRNPVSDVSSHFVIDYDGACAQMLDTELTAWTQGAGNGHWVSVEFAGFATGAYTPAQQETASQLYAWLHVVHGVPLQLADTPSGRGWGWHGMGGAAWGNHPGCPGAANVALRSAMLARTGQILGGVNPSPGPLPPPTTQGDPDMILIVQNGTGATYTYNGVHRMYQGNPDTVATLRGTGVALVPVDDVGQFGVEFSAEEWFAMKEAILSGGGGTGGGPSVAQIAAGVRPVVREELDKTKITGSLEPESVSP